MSMLCDSDIAVINCNTINDLLLNVLEMINERHLYIDSQIQSHIIDVTAVQ